MRHPQQMLGSNNAALYKWLKDKLDDPEGGIPPCTMKAAAKMGRRCAPRNHTSEVELPYALAQMVNAPVYWELEEATAVALLRTDCGVPNLRGFRLPYPCIWVGMPPLFNLVDATTGNHRIEGFYLVEDWAPNRIQIYKKMGIDPDARLEELTLQDRELIEAVFQKDFDIYRSVLVIGVGESRNGVVKRKYTVDYGDRRMNVEDICRDDALISFWIFTEDPDRPMIKPRYPGEGHLKNLTLNLLVALQDRYLHKHQIIPRKPKSPKKVKRALRRGITFDPFTVLRLTPRARSLPSSVTKEGSSRKRDRVIRGYWNHHWVKQANIQGRMVLGERQGKASRLFKVRKWIKPQIIGSPSSRTTLVKS